MRVGRRLRIALHTGTTRLHVSEPVREWVGFGCTERLQVVYGMLLCLFSHAATCPGLGGAQAVWHCSCCCNASAALRTQCTVCAAAAAQSTGLRRCGGDKINLLALCVCDAVAVDCNVLAGGLMLCLAVGFVDVLDCVCQMRACCSSSCSTRWTNQVEWAEVEHRDNGAQLAQQRAELSCACPSLVWKGLACVMRIAIGL